MEDGQVTIYTDGGCLGNPGPGGYAAVLLHGGRRKEIVGGYRFTTNNRMELMGAIAALEALKERRKAVLYSDSQYVVNAVSQGWAQRWKRNGWRKNNKEAALNPDLWTRLLDLVARHDVRFEWLRGHSGDVENERCDELARAESLRKDLPPDPGYGGGQ